MSVPAVTEDEIANAAGMGDVHDGVNFMRAACVIAMEKAKASFEPMLEALRHRSVHIMRRLFPIVEHMVRKGGSNLPLDSYNKPCQEMIRHIYEKFVDRYVDDCLAKCRDDLKGMTRFVTWDVDGKGGSSALYKSLPTPGKMVEIYSMAVDTRTIKTSAKQDENKNKKDKHKKDKNSSAADRVLNEWSSATGEPIDAAVSSSTQAQNSALTVSQKDFDNDAQLTDYHDLLQLTEEMLSGRNANRTSTVETNTLVSSSSHLSITYTLSHTITINECLLLSLGHHRVGPIHHSLLAISFCPNGCDDVQLLLPDALLG